MTLASAELLADLRADGWRTGDILSPQGGHLPHQMADICEPGNLQTVARALLLAWAEALAICSRLECVDMTRQAATGPDNLLRLPDKFVASLSYAPERLRLLARAVHEYMLARAWLAFLMTLPQADTTAANRRVTAARGDLERAAATALPPAEDVPGGGNGKRAFRRRLPLW